ncbi:H/ACA ribonucleoprotein complex non-core subunit NAF1 isoform X2 [Belonocnema kinseyi]|nr:H/ACA ribonucleoprotein complex non-core subunit NAF1 isoform X2 [Belonocnema kinseyi]XP_033207891.1 H/ACA ribonucleoprotein complex non-core subunit NAF1 isoform X2 [Belonocnema kinseyi]XP_033207892.1 H/ACA ribonucleoprotein complex non-core subunit NAF1 isoform X2 [Belonocnema kinseyi]XP_033207894.1 H/ACA ribonucleoprotein complex non-core subunit NAF1 isoform X2 [Belonocnema kinseyi]
MDYDTSDSEVEEVTQETQNSDAQNENVNEDEDGPVILKEYRTNIEITCSSDEVDSEDDSSSSEEESEESKSDNSSSDSSSEDESRKKESQKEKSQNVKTPNQRSQRAEKGEYDDLPPIEELQINVPEVLCDPLGEVAWIVDQMVVVRPKPGKPTLNIDTVLFVERGRRVLGRVFDVFGQVTDPHYCVRFNNSKHIEESKIQVGMNVYFCPNTEYTTVVFLHDLTKMKASDPTGDDEPPEFSDDEEEQAYYQNLRKQQKNDKVDSGSDIPNKRKRTIGPKPSGAKSGGPKSGWQSHHPWNTKRNPQNQHQGSGHSQPNPIDSQQPRNSQNWYGPPAYQQNLWPRFPPFPNPAWPSMYYSAPAYGDTSNFRSPMSFRPPFHPPPFSNNMPWNLRNQSQPPHNIQAGIRPAGNLLPLRPPPPPSSSPPPPPPPGV